MEQMNTRAYSVWLTYKSSRAARLEDTVSSPTLGLSPTGFVVGLGHREGRSKSRIMSGNQHKLTAFQWRVGCDRTPRRGC